MTKIIANINNFTKEELQCKCCGRINYDSNFLVRLQALRLLYGKRTDVTSGCRCKKNNKAAGGVATSLHECETKPASASDLTSEDCFRLYTKACTCGLFNEVEYHKNDGLNFVHVGWDPHQKGNAFKII